MELTVLRCDGCGKEVQNFGDVIRVYWPRRARDGYSLDPIVADYGSHRCMQIALRQKKPGDPCRPWCSSLALGTPGCDCLEDQPADNYDPWEAAGI